MSTPQVTIYSTPSCVYCRMAKAFLDEQKVPYTNYDVAEDAEKRNEMIQRSGQMGVPVIDVGGELMVGFDKEKLMKLLGLN